MGEPYRILLGKDSVNGQADAAGKWNADIWDSYGKQSMKGTIHA
jgi:hypothetical protein